MKVLNPDFKYTDTRPPNQNSKGENFDCGNDNLVIGRPLGAITRPNQFGYKEQSIPTKTMQNSYKNRSWY